MPKPPRSQGPPEISSALQTLVRSEEPLLCIYPEDRENQGPFSLKRLSSEPVTSPWVWGGSILAGDLNDDGWLELWFPEESGVTPYSALPGGITPMPPLPGDLTLGSGGVMADYDGDGDLDVYLARWVGWPGPEEPGYGANRLLRNDGDGTFTDVTELAGVDGCTEEGCLRSVATSFGDYDRDGDLDLFVGSHGYINPAVPHEAQDVGQPSLLYLNDGDGTFTDASELLPQALHDSYTLGGGWIDLDDDGWLDLYSVNDVGHVQPNVVVWNRGGALVYDPEEASGLVVGAAGMGLAWGDLNGDLRPDLVIPAWGELFYLQSVASIDVWVDATESSGITLLDGQKPGWGSELFDIDNDGDLDLISQFGFIADHGNPGWGNPRYQPDVLFINEGTPTDPTFTEQGSSWGLDDMSANRGVAVVDLNRDGFLDIVKHDLRGSIRIWMARCGDASWLRVHLEQPGTMNQHAVGAKIRVWSGEQVWTRTIRAGGSSIGVSLPPEAHFGLGQRDTIDRIEVTWPDGAVSSYDKEFLTRQEIRIIRY